MVRLPEPFSSALTLSVGAVSCYSSNMQIKTKVRRTHLGPRYDIYLDGRYAATAQSAHEIEPILTQLEAKYK